MQYTEASQQAAIDNFRNAGQGYNAVMMVCPECGGDFVFGAVTQTTGDDAQDAAAVLAHRTTARQELAAHLLA